MQIIKPSEPPFIRWQESAMLGQVGICVIDYCQGRLQGDEKQLTRLRHTPPGTCHQSEIGLVSLKKSGMIFAMWIRLLLNWVQVPETR